MHQYPPIVRSHRLRMQIHSRVKSVEGHSLRAVYLCAAATYYFELAQNAVCGAKEGEHFCCRDGVRMPYSRECGLACLRLEAGLYDVCACDFVDAFERDSS